MILPVIYAVVFGFFSWLNISAAGHACGALGATALSVAVLLARSTREVVAPLVGLFAGVFPTSALIAAPGTAAPGTGDPLLILTGAAIGWAVTRMILLGDPPEASPSQAQVGPKPDDPE
jgi:hypothetical protein